MQQSQKRNGQDLNFGNGKYYARRIAEKVKHIRQSAHQWRAEPVLEKDH